MADPVDLQAVRSVLASRKDELISRYHAEGAGVGKEESGKGYAIVVYVATSDLVPEERVEVEGIPLRFEVTGRFRPLDEEGEDA
jgi:hypothetical protein